MIVHDVRFVDVFDALSTTTKKFIIKRDQKKKKKGYIIKLIIHSHLFYLLYSFDC